MRIVVVGAGTFGASLAWTLAREGEDVTLVDQFEPGDPRASSGGESRLLRCSHGTDRWHTSSAWRSRELWRELDPELFVEVGVIWLAHRRGGWEDDSEAVLRELGVPVERLGLGQAAELLPGLAGADIEFALFEPAAGILRAQDAVRALVARATANGARLIQARAVPDGAAVRLAGGRRLGADRVVWACGAWLPALFPGLVRLTVTRQDLVFFDPPGDEWCTPPMPGWVDYDGAFYGTGDLDGYGVKLAPDVEGPAFDPRTEEREASAESVARAREYARLRFPALADSAVVGATACQYELTADTRFIAAPHPEDERVWIVGGGSGHGFKHAPALAEKLVLGLTGEASPDRRLGLGERRAERKLRTAGARGFKNRREG
jgi:glycine/D-amino acid oxidase-like deaminating enzyme